MKGEPKPELGAEGGPKKMLIERRKKGQKESLQYDYDDAGRLVKTNVAFENSAGRVERQHQFFYDNLGRKVKEEMISDWKRRSGSSGAQTCVNEYVYEGESPRPKYESTAHESGQRYAENEYDAEGRLVKKTTYSWDGLRQNEEVSVQTYAYDGQGRLSEMRDGHGWSFKYAYDGAGKLLRADRGPAGFEKPAGSVIYEYSDDGRTVSSQNVWLGEKLWDSVVTEDEQGNTVRYTFQNYEKGKPAGPKTETVFENVYQE